MREQIYTIPIGEAYERADGCPICALRRKLEQETLQYTLGGAMMEPDVRVAMNAAGFCPEHQRALMGMGNRLSLALILESRLDTLAQSPPDKLPALAGRCYVCERTQGFMDKILENILYLWETQPEFRERMASRRHCFTDTAQLLGTAQKTMRRRAFGQFAESFGAVAKAEAEALKASVSRFCRSFDHRFAGQNLGDDKQAVERASEWLA
jgi:hypothetical protein